MLTRAITHKPPRTQEGRLARKYFALAGKVRKRQRSQVIMAADDAEATTEFHARRRGNPGLRELHHSVNLGERRLVLSVA